MRKRKSSNPFKSSDGLDIIDESAIRYTTGGLHYEGVMMAHLDRISMLSTLFIIQSPDEYALAMRDRVISDAIELYENILLPLIDEFYEKEKADLLKEVNERKRKGEDITFFYARNLLGIIMSLLHRKGMLFEETMTLRI